MKLLNLIIILFLGINTYSQELNCSVQVAHPKIQGTNVQVFRSLEGDIFEFMNNKKWTNHVFDINERIECSILITISNYNGSDKFIGTIQVQSRRPIHNTSYNSTLLNYKEENGEFRFQYIEQQAFEFKETEHLSNLTSVLAFYAYIIIGFDYDSFSKESGTTFFQKAQTIANNAQSSSDVGWKPYESRKQNNRFFLIESLMNKQYSPIRQCIYKYHRLGLDIMSDKTQLGRAEIAESFKLLLKAHRVKPNAILMNMFFSAKSDEIVNIFSESFALEQKKVYNILKEVDLPNSQKYEKIIKKK